MGAAISLIICMCALVGTVAFSILSAIQRDRKDRVLLWNIVSIVLAILAILASIVVEFIV